MDISIQLQHLSDGKSKDCITFIVSTLGLLFVRVIIVLLSHPEQIQRQIRFHPGFHPVLPCQHVLCMETLLRAPTMTPSDPFITPPSPASIEWWTDKVQAVSRDDVNRQLRGLRARICAGDGWDLGIWDLWVHNWMAEWTVSSTCTSTNWYKLKCILTSPGACLCKQIQTYHLWHLPSTLNKGSGIDMLNLSKFDTKLDLE